MKLKKLAILFSIMFALSTLFSAVSFAKTNNTLSIVALGDSITYGYNLEPNQTGTSSHAFPNLIGNGNNDVTNLAHSGWTSADLLNALNTDPAFNEALQKADIVTVDIGSNDLLQAVDIAKLKENPAVLSTSKDEFTAEVTAKLTNAIAQLQTNIPAIMTQIRAQTSAPVVLYTIYNPFGDSTDPVGAFLHNLGEGVIPAVNKSIIQPTGLNANALLADAYSAFDKHQSTYVIPGDVYPTLLGHQVLADLATDLLGLKPHELSISLTASTDQPTTKPVQINVTVSEEVQELKWLPGEKTTADFASVGNNISGSSFDVTENSTYTVYGKTSDGIEAVKTITISNITAETAPSEEPKPTEDPTPATGNNQPVVTTPATGNNQPVTPTNTGLVVQKEGTVTSAQPATSNATSQTNELPDTATTAYNTLAAGLGLLLAGLIVLMTQRKLKKRSI